MRPNNTDLDAPERFPNNYSTASGEQRRKQEQPVASGGRGGGDADHDEAGAGDVASGGGGDGDAGGDEAGADDAAGGSTAGGKRKRPRKRAPGEASQRQRQDAAART